MGQNMKVTMLLLHHAAIKMAERPVVKLYSFNIEKGYNIII